MHISFKKVKLKNFMSFQEEELDFSSNGFTLVYGINRNSSDVAISNGGGKSALFESLFWCLTGETLRNTKQVANSYINKGVCVELDFDIDDVPYKLIRSREDEELGTNLKIYINGEDKSGKGIRDTEKLLSNYLPNLTTDLIGSVIILGQGLPQRFTNNTPSGRKEILEKLSKSDFMIEDIKTKLGKRQKELSDEFDRIKPLTIGYVKEGELLRNNLQELKEDKALLDCNIDYDADIELKENQLIREQKEQIQVQELYNKLNEDLNKKLKEYQDWTSKVNENYLYECSVIDDNANINNLKKENIELENQIKNKEQEIKKLENIKDICPTCGQKLPNVHKVDLAPYERELELLRKRFEEFNANFIIISDGVRHKKEEVLNKLNATSEEIKQEGQKIRKEFNDANDLIQNYNKYINNLKLDISRIKLNKENYEKQKNTIDDDIKKCEERIEEITKKIDNNNKLEEDITNHLNIVQKIIGFTTREFRGILLNNVIEYIRNKFKEYAKIIFNAKEVEFKLDGNNIYIGYDDKVYESLSGGEKQKVDIIIQLCLRDMLCKYFDFSSNILVLDEIFDNLDLLGCQKIINLITSELSDVENVYIISHHVESLQIPHDEELVIEKNEKGISHIKGR